MLIEQYILKLKKDGKTEKAAEIQELLDTSGTRKSLTEDLYDIIIENEIKSPILEPLIGPKFGSLT